MDEFQQRLQEYVRVLKGGGLPDEYIQGQVEEMINQEKIKHLTENGMSLGELSNQRGNYMNQTSRTPPNSRSLNGLGGIGSMIQMQNPMRGMGRGRMM